MKAVEVLMIEDNQGDVVLVETAIEKAKLPYHITVVSDGAEAVEYLHRRSSYAAAPAAGPDPAGSETPAKERLRSARRNPPRPLPGANTARSPRVVPSRS